LPYGSAAAPFVPGSTGINSNPSTLFYTIPGQVDLVMDQGGIETYIGEDILFPGGNTVAILGGIQACGGAVAGPVDIIIGLIDLLPDITCRHCGVDIAERS